MPCEVHPTQPKITVWTHAKMFHAMQSERTIGHANRCANFGYIKWVTFILTQRSLKPLHDMHSLMSRRLILDCFPVGQTENHRPHQLLFDRPRNLGMREDIWDSHGKSSCCLVKVQ